jgi:hypothetical protein
MIQSPFANPFAEFVDYQPDFFSNYVVKPFDYLDFLQKENRKDHLFFNLRIPRPLLKSSKSMPHSMDNYNLREILSSPPNINTNIRVSRRKVYPVRFDLDASQYFDFHN